jgi:hypothetical protein
VVTIEEEELNYAKGHLAYWQRELRLDHIDFELKISPIEEFGKRLAVCNVGPSKHRQKIIIRHPSERSEADGRDFRRDLEVVIVHELLHTKEFPWRDHPKVDAAMESDQWLVGMHEDSLDAVAEALVRARRGLRR